MKEKVKTCIRCFMVLPATPEFFYTQYYKSTGKTYLRSFCKECSKDLQIENYDKTRGAILDKRKATYLEKKKALQNSVKPVIL